MKKIFVGLFALVSLGLGVGLGVGASHNSPVAVKAEEEVVVAEATVVIEEVQHAKILPSISEGSIGDVCVLSIKNDFLYNIKRVSVNGTDLVESESTFGEYSFALVAGENKVLVEMVFDEEAAGVFATSIEAVQQKDWTKLFSVENIMSILGWVLNGGILITVIRYFIRDKRLAAKVEKATKDSLNQIVPETTKQVIMDNFEKVITPIFTQLTADNSEMKKALGVFAKCMALSQENSPEARKAIIDELSSIKIGNNEDIYNLVKSYIENLTAETKKALNDTLAQIKEIQNNSNKVIEEVEASKVGDDGTQI